MRLRTATLARTLLAALLLGGCDFTDGDEVLTLDASGAAAAVAFMDNDQDGRPGGQADVPVPGMRVFLLRGAGDTVASAVTGADGRAVMPAVPVGSYRVLADPVWLGDSVRVAGGDTLSLLVAREDTALATLALGYPTVEVAQARQRTGVAVSVEAVALSAWAAFGDSSVHVADPSGALRVLRVGAPGIEAGDSVRLTGRMGRSEGQPVLIEPSVRALGQADVPDPPTLSTAAAASADGGRLDAAQAAIAGAEVIDAVRTGAGDLRVRADDGSGVLEVLLDRSAGIVSDDPLLPGATLDARGVLVPTGSGAWQLKPRGSLDVAVRYEPVRVADARGMVGKVVAVEALALNGWVTFGDGSLHVVDASGAMRVVSVPQSFVETGDSLRLLGVVSVSDGQPVLAGPAVTIIARGRAVPSPQVVSTAAAADAAGGALDARLVRVVRATVADTLASGGDLRLVVNDGSGPLTLWLDRDTGLGFASYAPGVVVDATGLLVPFPGGRGWILKPRGPGDLAVP